MPNLWTRGKVVSANKSVGDPNQTHRFTVEIDGVTLGGIHRVDGIVHEHEVITTHDGDMQHQQLAPGRIVQGTITIERDFVATREFVDWRRTVIDGKTVRKSMSVVALAPDGTESIRFNFFECFPSKYTGPSFNSRNSANATESLEIVYESYETT
jgi:phage tail-like protein